MFRLVRHMDLAVTPDTYTPSVDEKGQFVDSTIRECVCPCSGRYYKRESFGGHVKTQRHLRWLKELNMNRSNFLRVSIEQEATIREQRRMIAHLSNEIDRLKRTAPVVEDLITL